MKKTQAFTLIELSIVLVIIGLIVGGILAGKSLIRAAELRKVNSEFDQFQASIVTFKLKYNCLPGDCANATQFFGSAGGTGTMADATCRNAANTNKGSTGTCNGDGDGGISEAGTVTFGATSNYGYERYSMWQHLALASLAEGSYAVTGQGGTAGHVGGYNVPKSNADTEAGWAILRIDNGDNYQASGVFLYDGPAPSLSGRHALVFGQLGQGTSAPMGFLPPADAYDLDTKRDDGMPFTGTVTTIYRVSNTTSCTAASTPTTPYPVTQSSKGCLMFFTLSGI